MQSMEVDSLAAGFLLKETCFRFSAESGHNSSAAIVQFLRFP